MKVQCDVEDARPSYSADDASDVVPALGVTSYDPVPFAGIKTGRLVGITDNGCTPLVTFPGQPGSAAIAARAIIDLHGSHIGGDVALMFDACDPKKPIVMGVLRNASSTPMDPAPGCVEVGADGRRLLVTASESLVLRCGKASVTLTKEGKVIIQGLYVSTYSSGVNRIRGGSVQIN